RLPEDQRLDLAVEALERPKAKRTRVTGWQVREHHHDGTRIHHGGDIADQSGQSGHIAATLLVRRHVRRHVDDVASLEVAACAREALARAVATDQLVKARLEYRHVLPGQTVDQRPIRIEAHELEAACGHRRGRHKPEGGHTGETNDRRRHSPPFTAIACALRRCSTLCSQMSFERSVFAPERQSVLKCAYSRAQVGSSCTRVSVFSGGRPLGKTRVRLVNADGPHLHSDWMCAGPRPAMVFLLNWLSNISQGL